MTSGFLASHQGTLAETLVFEGLGVHTGENCRVSVHPAPVGYKRRFVAADGTEFPAQVDCVVSCDRSTILGIGEARVHTPEHLLSALFACGVDNARIELTGPEIPILDGAALEFYRGIQAVGVKRQGALAEIYSPIRPYSVTGKNGDLVLLLPATELSFHYVLYYEHPMLGCQAVDFATKTDSYLEHIAPARTFALWEEVKPLLERGMAQGGTLENALVVYQDRFSSALTVPLEPVRHKCLDLIGDFALVNARFHAKVLAVKAGHRLHVECARLLWEEMREK